MENQVSDRVFDTEDKAEDDTDNLQDTNGRLPAGNLNSSFPSVDLPYISSSVNITLSVVT